VGRGETFDFEKLNVYQRASNLADRIFEFCDKLPYKLQSSLGDQLRRASLSVCNNIAEGSDERGAKEKSAFYRHALSSMRECVPAFSLANRRAVLTDEQLAVFREESLIICRMLRKLIDSVEDRPR
jgi:four helix bundle protein